MHDIQKMRFNPTPGHTRLAWLPRAALLGAALACGMAVMPAGSQARFPTGTVKVVVPFGPGTGPDILGRTLGQKLSEKWGQPVLIGFEN